MNIKDELAKVRKVAELDFEDRAFAEEINNAIADGMDYEQVVYWMVYLLRSDMQKSAMLREIVEAYESPEPRIYTKAIEKARGMLK